MNSTVSEPLVLIIEDDDSLRKALSERLTREGIQTIGARHGAEGLEKIREREPQLVLLDLSMPVMSGFEMLDLLKKTNMVVPHTVILTNDEHMVTVSGAIDHGITDYLLKADTPIERVIDVVCERLNITKHD